MDTIMVKGKILELDENGFLANPDEWNRDVAAYFAEIEGIKMTEHHWDVVDFLRGYYQQNKIAPMIKILVNKLGKKHGAEKAGTKYLYQLYPCGLARQACKIAGLPKATGCV